MKKRFFSVIVLMLLIVVTGVFLVRFQHDHAVAQQTGTQRWEYYTFAPAEIQFTVQQEQDLNVFNDPLELSRRVSDAVTARLNDLAAEGWELMGFGDSFFVLRRPAR